MLKIRLARGGAKKRPYYSIVVADSHSPRDGRFIEKVGTYDPLLKRDNEKRVTLNGEKITAWLAKGAQPTDRVARFLAAQGLSKWEPGQNPKKGEPHAKAKERATERAEREAAAAAARAEAAARPPEPEPEMEAAPGLDVVAEDAAAVVADAPEPVEAVAEAAEAVEPAAEAPQGSETAEPAEA